MDMHCIVYRQLSEVFVDVEVMKCQIQSIISIIMYCTHGDVFDYISCIKENIFIEVFN